MIAGIYCWSKLLKTRSTFNSSVFNIYLHEFGEYHSNGPTLFSGLDSWTSWIHDDRCAEKSDCKIQII